MEDFMKYKNNYFTIFISEIHKKHSSSPFGFKLFQAIDVSIFSPYPAFFLWN